MHKLKKLGAPTVLSTIRDYYNIPTSVKGKAFLSPLIERITLLDVIFVKTSDESFSLLFNPISVVREIRKHNPTWHFTFSSLVAMENKENIAKVCNLLSLKPGDIRVLVVLAQDHYENAYIADVILY